MESNIDRIFVDVTDVEPDLLQSAKDKGKYFTNNCPLSYFTTKTHY